MSENRKEATIGEFVTLDYYDGPLLEAAKVTCETGEVLIEIRTHLVARVEGDWPWQKATLRLSRDELQKMIEILDAEAPR